MYLKDHNQSNKMQQKLDTSNSIMMEALAQVKALINMNSPATTNTASTPIAITQPTTIQQSTTQKTTKAPTQSTTSQPMETTTATTPKQTSTTTVQQPATERTNNGASQLQQTNKPTSTNTTSAEDIAMEMSGEEIDELMDIAQALSFEQEKKKMIVSGKRKAEDRGASELRCDTEEESDEELEIIGGTTPKDAGVKVKQEIMDAAEKAANKTQQKTDGRTKSPTITNRAQQQNSYNMRSRKSSNTTGTKGHQSGLGRRS